MPCRVQARAHRTDRNREKNRYLIVGMSLDSTEQKNLTEPRRKTLERSGKMLEPLLNDEIALR